MPVHKNLIFPKYVILCLTYYTQFCPIGEIFFLKSPLYTGTELLISSKDLSLNNIFIQGGNATHIHNIPYTCLLGGAK